MNKCVLLLCSLVVLNFNNSLHAQGTAFTYQGKLNNNGAPATGSYDLSFTIYDAVSSGNVIAGPLTNAATAVSNGLFTVQLDFGPGVFNGNARWIGIAVRTNGTGTFSILSPRQDVTSTPYAIQSANAQTAATASAVTGPISLSQLPGVVLTNGGNIVGNGAGLSNVNALTFSGLTTNQFVITPLQSVPFATNVYASNGVYTITAPASATELVAKLWGAGGSTGPPGAAGLGGGGAFVQKTIAITPGETLTIVVGQAGNYSIPGSGGAGSNDGAGGGNTLGGNYRGGQASSLFTVINGNYVMQAVAGGGGSGGEAQFGPANGGAGGNPGQSGQGEGGASGGTGGSNGVGGSLGGAAYATNATTTGLPSLSGMGGNGGDGQNYSGGGGGGYGGGGGGGPTGNGAGGGGGGGGSYGDIIIGGNGYVPGNTNDADYISPQGFGALSAGGEDGLVVITFLQHVTTVSGVLQAAGFVGSGSGLTGLTASQIPNLNASNITTGTFDASRISGGPFNPALIPNLDASKITTGTFDASIIGSGIFNPALIPNLDASKITSGTIALGQLPSAVLTNNESGVTLSGTFNGNGAGLTGVNLLNANADGAISYTTNWGYFPARNSAPGVGGNPYGLTAADVNGDGKMDLICANQADNTLTILTNNGGGFFSIASNPGVGNNPVVVVAADVNGDGKVDLVCGNANDNTLTVLTNNGSGGFARSATLSVAVEPISIAAADVNGDGKVDLISAGLGGNAVTVLTNNGSGGFALSANLSVGGPAAVAMADVNGDGKVDLICASEGTPNFIVFTNNGSGGFVTASTPTTPGHIPLSIAAADFNGDGKVDFVAGNGDGTLTVLTNNGSGGFALSETVTVDLGGGGGVPNSVAVADVNNDGKMDVITVNYVINVGGNLVVLTNNGTGGLVVAASPSVYLTPSAVVAVDVNGDGQPDLISTAWNDNLLTVIFNVPTYTGNFRGNFSGNVSGLTLSSAVLTNTETGVTLSGTFSGNGSGLTNLNGTQISTGTIADARLSTNVALRAGGNTFSGTQIFTSGNVGIGVANPQPFNTLQINQIYHSANGYALQVDNPQYGQNIQVDQVSGAIGLVIDNHANGDSSSALLLVRNNLGGSVQNLLSVQTGSQLLTVGTAYCTGTTWVNNSDRSLKDNFSSIDPLEVLEKVSSMPITQWTYKTETNALHMGPMAQDFYQQFRLGADQKAISTVDEGGVALAAIKGLNQKLEMQLKEKDAQIGELHKQLQELEKAVNSLKEKK